MKKIIMAAAIVCAAVVQAASVSWTLTGATSADVGATVYLLASVDQSYASVEALADAAIDSGAVAKSGKVYKVAQVDTMDGNVTKDGNYYLAILDANGKDIHVLDVSGSLNGFVYDSALQETSPGVFSTTFASVTGASIGSKIESVPEPTSGLLLLLGMAGLALKRKRA